MSNLETCLAFTLVREGGFVNDPVDPGGATNHGITLATLRAWRGAPVSVEDVRNLTAEDAKPIYGTNYWNPIRGDQLPPGVDLSVFDFGVNAGTRRTAEQLQEIVGVTVDGHIGPKTLAAVNEADPAKLIEALCVRHEAYYQTLPTFWKFGKGWTSRAEACKAASLEILRGANARPSTDAQPTKRASRGSSK